MIDYTPKKPKQTFTGFANKNNSRPKKTAIVSPISSGYNPRETKKYPSLATPGGSTAPRNTVQYTGDKMLGVTILHKSCLQPVFNQEAAIDAASMRR